MKSGQLTSWMSTTLFFIIVVGREVLGRSILTLFACQETALQF